MPRKKAWVEALLTKREAIERAVGVPLGIMLGCGHWGCVFESEPPWVVKLSIDPTEGPIWSKIAGLMRDEVWGLQGFPEIKSLHRIVPDIVYGGRKRKVWAIVRENVVPVFVNSRRGLSFSDFTRAKYGLPEGVSPHGRALAQYGRDAEDLQRALDGLHEYKRAAQSWHDFHGIPSQRETHEYRMQRVAEIAFQGPACAPLGESLNMLASHGVYLRDVHLLNIGWHVGRDDDDWDRIVIFDPGHTPTAGGEPIEQALVENGREAL